MEEKRKFGRLNYRIFLSIGVLTIVLQISPLGCETRSTLNSGQKEKAKIELDRRDVDAATKDDFIDAIAKGNTRIFKRLLETNPALVNVRYGDSKQTPLFSAAFFGRREFAEMLLSKGADPEARDKRGQTPLWIAAFSGKNQIVKLLLEKGASVNVMTQEGFTPLHIAVVRGHKDVTETLLAKGANPNAGDASGVTPLFGAAQYGQAEVAELLLRSGAQINAKNSKGKTALSYAREDLKKEQDYVRFLRTGSVDKPVEVLLEVQEEKITRLKKTIDVLLKYGGSND